MKNKNKAKISYEPEADVLMWEITDKPIDFAKEIGNVVVHFAKNNLPVLIEILEASKFLNKAKSLIEKEKISIRKPVLVSR
jgi:uncharacterized protein YuzE